MRPRIKDEHRPVRLREGWVRIGGKVFGIAANLRDPDGAVWALLELMDGSRTADQIVAELVSRFPLHPQEEVHAAIEQLTGLGYVQDADEGECVALSERQRERYARSRLLYRWIDRAPRTSSWEFQVRLSRARVVVVGVGGVGCTAALALALSGVGRLHCVDPDRVELSNLNRQILYDEQDLGRMKVAVAMARLRAANSDVEVTGESTLIDGPGALRALASDCDVLVMSADEPAEIRSWANEACGETGTAWVYGGYHGPQANMGVYRPGSGPCFDCAREAEQDRAAAQPAVASWRPEPVEPPMHAANAVTAGIVGNLVAHAVMSLITGAPALAVNCQYGFNLVTLDHSFVTTLDQPHPRCRICQTAA